MPWRDILACRRVPGAIPPGWWSTDVRGELTITTDWGDATFVADDGQTLTLGGGRLTAIHHATGQN